MGRSKKKQPEADSLLLLTDLEEEEGTFINKAKLCTSLSVMDNLIKQEFSAQKLDEMGQMLKDVRAISKKSTQRTPLKSKTWPNFREQDKFRSFQNLVYIVKIFRDQVIPSNVQEVEELQQRHQREIQLMNSELSVKQEKIDSLELALSQAKNQENSTFEKLNQDVETTRKVVSTKNAKITELESENLKLIKQIDDGAKKIEKLKLDHDEAMEQKNAKVKELEDQVKTLTGDITEKASELDILRETSEFAKEQSAKWEKDFKGSEKHGNELRLMLDEKAQMIVELESSAAQKDARIFEQQAQLGETQRNAVSLEKNICQLEGDLKANEEIIQEYQDAIGEKEKQLKHLSNKLSAEMSTKLAADESNVENVSIKNRPMNVAEQYQMACTDQWLDAKTTLDDVDGMAEHIKMQLLCQVIQTAETEAKAVYDSIIKSLEKLQSDPIIYVSRENKSTPNDEAVNGAMDSPRNTPKSTSQLSKEVTNSHGDMLRIKADTVDIGPLIRRVTNALGELHKESEIGDLWTRTCDKSDVVTYVETMARVCWKMALQRPQMELKAPDEYQGDKSQDLAWNSAMPGNPDMVLIYVYPMLYHGKSLMAKAKVLLLDPKKLDKDG